MEWARRIAELQRKGRTEPRLEAMIAASAFVHDLTLVTRNVRDFQKAGVKVLNPF